MDKPGMLPDLSRIFQDIRHNHINIGTNVTVSDFYYVQYIVDAIENRIT